MGFKNLVTNFWLSGAGGGFERGLFEQRRNVVRCWTRMGAPMRAQVEVSLTMRKRRCSCSGPKYELEWQNLIRTVVRTSRK